jgi:hypothetical protein
MKGTPMAKIRKFKTNTGSPVTIFLPDGRPPILVPYYAPYLETDDPATIDALEGSPEVVEVEAKKK